MNARLYKLFCLNSDDPSLPLALPLSLVSNPFKRLISSPELYVARSLLQATENVLYVAMRFHLEKTHCWYSLNLKPFKNESTLVPIPTFPSIPYWGSSVIAIGYEMYVFGGCIDCRTHTSRFLSSMRVARGCAATGVIDGKVYMIGGCKARPVDWIEMFDLKTKKWESVPGPCNEQVEEIIIKSVVMDEKIYVMEGNTCFVYDPKEKSWAVEKELNLGWEVGSCVIDNMLYSLGGIRLNQIKLYDPRTKVWRVLKGVEDLHDRLPCSSRLANHGGKLAVVVDVGKKRMTEVRCTEIELERRGGGKVWGRIVSSNGVLSKDGLSTIVKCVTVRI